ncbi:MAG: acyl-CoA dehydrogenase family protein [Sphingomonas sp.]|uniref:acyl-CoA dehydrogenase family protein n=1 Tax=Sphingomonas sp. TaxID=28214 RepID=UPI00227404D0|nr:acyl-CoA dehydrogenase family protein [Sphingomonas sp.]MCX8477796.1 acyl-CoA dehydrogenase family protein [Sphingomonas sp.]
MRLEPSEEQILLRDTVSRFLADRVDAALIGAGPMPAPDWRGIADLGLLAFLLEGAADDATIVAEALGRALAITPLGEGVIGAGDLVARHGDAAAIERFVAPLLAGDSILALARGAARASPGGVSGRLDFVRWAPEAAAIVVLAEDVAHVVATDADGVAMTPHRLADGTPAATVTLSDAPATVIPLPPGAAATAFAMVDLAHAAELIGAMALLCALTADYVATRRQFGVEIGSFQVVQHKRARMFVALEQARSLAIKAAAIGRDDPGFVRAAWSAKAYAAEAAQRLAEEAVQLHGGIGVTDELAVGRGLRRVMVLARLFGGAGEARVKLAA